MRFTTMVAVAVLGRGVDERFPGAAHMCLTASAIHGFATSPVSNDTQLSLGFTFTVTAPTVVGGLGYWDQGGDGFLTPHEVGLFLGDGADGPGPLLLSTTLAAGKSGVLVRGGAWGDGTMAPSGFRYRQTSALPAETMGFVFGSLVAGLDYAKHVYIGPNAAPYAYRTPTLADPSSHFGDYQFYAVNFVAVPEPAMMLVGFAGLGFVEYRRSRVGCATIAA